MELRTASKRVPLRYTRNTRAAIRDASNGSAPTSFWHSLESELRADSNALLGLLQTYGAWDPHHDAKLDALHALLTETFPDQKVLVFSQFADTVYYLEAQLKSRGVQALAGVTGNSADPTQLAWQFSPHSNQRPGQGQPEHEFRVLVATDVLSEGQNLQDCHVVVNYDLPWAIIRNHSAGRSGGPHRAEGGGDSVLLLLTRRRSGTHHQPA